ncbi:hypothetical protein BHE74_00030072 [Ensete ventricosum]|nr:hypothetical protein BHE74_00030072 [Ensete ventricosum]
MVTSSSEKNHVTTENERASISGVRSMDLKEMVDGCGGPWTEERHSAFLNWVEESFVRRVLAARGNHPGPHLDLDLDVELGTSGWLPPPLPLDRFLPDSATESNRNPGRSTRPARTRRSATTAAEAEEPGRVSDHSHRCRGHTSACSSLPCLRYGDRRCCDRVIFPVGMAAGR